MMPKILQWAAALATLLLIAAGLAFGTPAEVPATSQQTFAAKCMPQMPHFRPGPALYC